MDKKWVDKATQTLTTAVIASGVAATGTVAIANQASAQSVSRQDTYGDTPADVDYADRARLESERTACEEHKLSNRRIQQAGVISAIGALAAGGDLFKGALNGAARQGEVELSRSNTTADICSRYATDLNDYRNRKAAARNDSAKDAAAQLGIKNRYGGDVIVPNVTLPQQGRSSQMCDRTYIVTLETILKQQKHNDGRAAAIEAQRAKEACIDGYTR